MNAWGLRPKGLGYTFKRKETKEALRIRNTFSIRTYFVDKMHIKGRILIEELSPKHLPFQFQQEI